MPAFFLLVVARKRVRARKEQVGKKPPRVKERARDEEERNACWDVWAFIHSPSLFTFHLSPPSSPHISDYLSSTM
jgi:hypothetical protein